MDNKKIICYINAENEIPESVVKQSLAYEQSGADELFLYNYSMVDMEKEEFLHTVRQVSKAVDIPVTIGVYVKRLEDIKKAYYTGAKHVCVQYAKINDVSLLKEGAERFGRETLIVEYDASSEKNDSTLKIQELSEELKNLGVSMLLLKHVYVSEGVISKINNAKIPVIIRDSLLRNDMQTLISIENVYAVATNFYEKKDINHIKNILKDEGINVSMFDTSLSFDDFKTDASGLVPVVVQDYKTKEVLMVAYMNKESYEKTIETGKMTYFSRSRQCLWVKGETSGHFQYVKSLSIDCDNDTILALVLQIGAACHTGNHSCFYRNLVKKEYSEADPSTVLKSVYDTITDRKKNPKEGSYTNYLFDKGIDKILKKCGEEASEIIIAAKNPDPEEVKYEMADFLYHMMVLMVEQGLDWEDIMKELANRR